MEKDQYYMNLALQEAKKGRFQTWKNPMVGAVIVKNNQVLATGHHIHYGQNHAERDAISKLTPEQLFNSTLYVTLEPCNHYGKQPPCSDLIVKSKIKRVVIGQVDPHKLVTGKGIAKLKSHNIEVKTGVLTSKIEELNKFYNYFYRNNKPWITIKEATSLDYRVSQNKNTRTNITNQSVYFRVHQERANYQAIMIGSSTAIIDDPSLLTSVKTDYPPIRVIVDRRGRLLNHLDLKVLTDHQSLTWIFTQNKDLIRKKFNDNIQVLLMKSNELSEVVNKLAQREIQSIYVEGGPTLARSFLNEDLANELIDYIPPTFLGSAGPAGVLPRGNLNLHNVQIENLNNNIRIDGEINV